MGVFQGHMRSDYVGVEPPLTGTKGPMTLNRNGFLKFILVLYLLGVKKCGHRDLKELFSNDPILGEPWLKKITNRNDMQRFIRQVRVRVRVRCSLLWRATWQYLCCPFLLSIFCFDTRNDSVFFLLSPSGHVSVVANF